MTTREEEIQLYRDAYKATNYGMGQRRRDDVYGILYGLKPKTSLLDISTGRGETLRMADLLGFKEVRGTEAVEDLCVGRVTRYTAEQELPFLPNSIAHVTCFDVLEHLLEEDIEKVLREMCRVAVYTVTVSASERPSCLGPGGRDLHISKRPKAEWLYLLQSIDARWHEKGKAGGSPAFQINFLDD